MAADSFRGSKKKKNMTQAKELKNALHTENTAYANLHLKSLLRLFFKQNNHY